MVLVLKHWESRSPPGIIADGRGTNPFTISKSRCRCKPRGGFFVSGLGASEEGAIEVRSTSQGRPAARTPDLIRGREAKPTDVGTGA